MVVRKPSGKSANRGAVKKEKAVLLSNFKNWGGTGGKSNTETTGGLRWAGETRKKKR